MTTYISLASSATMFPMIGDIRCSLLTPELVQRRLAYPDITVSALNTSHSSTIDAIKRRYDLSLPLPPPGPAPRVALSAGDELFIVQANFSRRLQQGEVYSDEEVNAAPISFLRWRVPMTASTRAPSWVPQSIFDRIIDNAFSVALWTRGAAILKDEAALLRDLDSDLEEFYSENVDIIDAYMEIADILYKCCCHWQVTEGRESHVLVNCMVNVSEYLESNFNQVLNEALAFDVMLRKYGRRASGWPKDFDAERQLTAELFA